MLLRTFMIATHLVAAPAFADAICDQHFGELVAGLAKVDDQWALIVGPAQDLDFSYNDAFELQVLDPNGVGRTYTFAESEVQAYLPFGQLVEGEGFQIEANYAKTIFNLDLTTEGRIERLHCEGNFTFGS